ncbi:ribonuclease P protein component [Bacteroidota bacterium]
MFTFKKHERLKSKKTIELLFKHGNILLEFPVKAVWIKTTLSEKDTFLQVAFSVPKRLFKKAVDRNRIKRLLRESYRLQKTPLISSLQKENTQVAVMFVYLSDNLTSFKSIERKIIVILNRLESLISKTSKLN